MTDGLEYLVTRGATFELAADGTAFVGRAMLVGQYARIGDHWETIDTRALDRPEGEDTILTFDHNQSGVLARTTSGTLILKRSADGTALEVRADIAPTTLGNDVRILLARRDVTSMSFAMRKGTITDEWTVAPDGLALRSITGFRLMDVSIVPRPAYQGTAAELRSVTFDEILPIPRSTREKLLRARGRRI
jgi:HK97 family phage prohead protease